MAGDTAQNGQLLLTYRQAGDLLGVCEKTAWTLVHDGQLPAVRIGRAVRIDRRDLVAFIDATKQPVERI